MGKLRFKIHAEYEKVDRLKKSIADLKAELMGLTPASKEFKTICSSIEKQQKEVVKLSQEVAKLETIQARTAATKARQAATELNAMSRIEVATSRKATIEQQSVAKVDAIKRRSAEQEAINEQRRARAAAMAEKARVQLSYSIERCTNSIKRENVAISDQTRLLDNLKAGIAGVFAADQGKELIQAIIHTRGEFQQLQISFETILGSKTKADKLMSQVIDFTAKTPFSLQEVAKGSKQLLAYGSTANTVIDELRMMGDVASGVSAPIGDLIYLYGTLRSQGRAYSVDIRQFAGRGIPIYEELGKVLKVSTGEVNALVSAGKVGFPQVEQAFKNMTSQGGKFFDLTAKNATSLTGLTSNLGDAWSRMLNNEGTKHEEFFGDMIKGATQAVDSYEDYLNALKAIIATYGVYKAAVIAMNIAKQVELVGGLTNAIRATTVAQKRLNSATLKNPYVIAATAIAGLVSVLIASTSSQKQHKEAIQATLKPLKDEYTQTNTLVGKLKDANIEETERTRILKELKGINPDIVKGIEDESKAYEILSKKLEGYNKVKLAEIHLKQFSIDGGLTAATVDLEEAKDKVEAKKPELIGIYSDLFTAINQINIPVETKSIFENIFNSEKPEYEKVEEMFKEYHKLRERFLDVRSGHLNDGSYSKDVYESAKTDFAPLKDLFSGYSISEYTNSVYAFTRASEEYNIKVVEVDKKILKTANALAKDTQEEKKIIDNLTSAIFPSRKKADGGEGGKKKPEVQNKKYWTGEKQEAETELDGLSKLTIETEEGAAKYKAAQKKLAEAINELKWYDRSEAKVSAKNNPVKLLEQLVSKELSAQEKINATRVALMKDGASKQKAQAEVTHQKEITRINKEEQEKLSLYDDYVKKGGKPIEGKKESIKNDAVTQRSQADDVRSKDIKEIEKKTANEIKKIWENVTRHFGSELDKQLADIDNFYNEQVEKAKDNQELINKLNEARSKDKQVVTIEQELRTTSFNQEIALSENDNKYSDSGMVEVAERTKNEILKKYAEERIKLLESIGDEQATQEAATLKQTIDGYDKVLAQPKTVKGLIDEKLFKAVQTNFEKTGLSAEEAEAKTESFFGGFSKAGDIASDVVGTLQGLFGGLSDELDMALEAVGNIAQGFAEGGLVGGLNAAAGQVISVVANLLTAKKEVDQSMIDGYNAYVEVIDRLVDKQIESLSSLGGKEFGDAIKKTFDDLNKKALASRRLLQETMASGSGVFSHSEGYKANKMLGQQSKYLREAGIYKTDLNKMTNEELIKLMDIEDVWSRMPDSLKTYIETLGEAQGEVDALNTQLQDMILGFSGTDSITDAIVSSLTDPSIDDAMGDLSGKMDNIIGDIVKNMIVKFALVGPVTKAVDELMKGLAVYDKDGNITGLKDVEDVEASVLAKFKDTIAGLADGFSEKWNGISESLNGAGININGSDKDSQQNATGKGIQTMSQDTGNELNGRFTALQMAGEEIKQENIKQTSFLQSILNTIMRVPTPDNVVNIADYSVQSESAVQSDRFSSDNLIKMLNTTMSIETIGNSQLTTMNALRDLAEDSYVELVEIRNNTENTVKALKMTNERLASMNQSFKDFNGK